jgi:hypothetical protein
MEASFQTLRLGQKQGPDCQSLGLAYLAGCPAKSHSVTALSTDTDTPGLMVELSAILFM